MTDPDALRARAHDILQESRFHQRRTPGPFRGVLNRLGELLDPVLGPVGRFFLRISSQIAQWWGETVTRAILVIAVIGIAVMLVTLLARRRSAASIRHARHADEFASADPRDLERAADKAEANGDFSTALRLRFQAGVLRLQIDGRVRRGRTTTTRALARQLRSADFDRLGMTFDAVAYGGRAASAQDAAQAKDEWRRVLAGSSS